MDPDMKVESLHPLEVKVLRAFEGTERLGNEQLEAATALDASRVRRALEWLLTKKALDVVAEETRKYMLLTETGEDYAKNRVPELRILEKAETGTTMDELNRAIGLDPAEVSPAIGALKKAGFLTFGAGGLLTRVPGMEPTEPLAMQAMIERYLGRGELLWDDIPAEDRDGIENLSRKRGKSKGVFRINERTFRTYALTGEGRSMLAAVKEAGLTGEEVSQVLPQHLKDGAWRSVGFRRYSLDLKPPRIVVGKRNPYREFLDFVKRKLLALGFEEMMGDHVEPEFWNMDALFMPQFHAARDIHDAYFIKDPSHAVSLEEPYFSRVADVHRDGGDTGSTGWRYDFDEPRSRRLLLRSQGTALSARQLHQARIPGKYFAMARCFRYDSIDQTHAADFFQIEGIVLSESNSLRTLLGLLKLFAIEVAQAEDIKFTAGYFPFTEPSVEAHIKHPKIGWMEMGGAGIFRPEVTRPQGIDVPVIAWGLGLDRMAMVAMGINDIRELFTTDLNRIRNTRAHFDK